MQVPACRRVPPAPPHTNPSFPANAGQQGLTAGGASQRQLGEGALRVWNAMGDAIVAQYRYEEFKGCWIEDEHFVIVLDGEEDTKVRSKCQDNGQVLQSMTEVMESVLTHRQARLNDREEGSQKHLALEQEPSGKALLEQHGWLKKKRYKFPQILQDRYFSLAKDGGKLVLKYWEVEPFFGEEPLGVIDMSTVTEIEDRKPYIALTANQVNKARTRPFELYTKNPSLHARWVAALRAAREGAQAQEHAGGA